MLDVNICALERGKHCRELEGEQMEEDEGSCGA